MLAGLAYRLMTETDPRLLAKCAWNLGWKGMRSVRAFEKRRNQGRILPPFLFISVTSLCNLRCQGCWVTPGKPGKTLSLETLDRIVRQAKPHGCTFYGILGGEPLLHPQLIELFARHPDCYFQLFTNGTMLTDDVARELRRVGNVTPLISVEGLEKVSDERRGGHGVYQRATDALGHCRRHRLLTGVATSVCRSNFKELVSETFARDLIRRGVHYLWYYIYRPVGPHPSPELSLTADEIVELRRFMVDLRGRVPLAIVDAYWDAEGRAVCPAAIGISHHIGPGGDIEPCPPMQFARDNVHETDDVPALMERSEYLEHFRAFAAGQSRGCLLLENPSGLGEFMQSEQARDSSGRGTAYAELAAMQGRPGHNQPGREIPERHWMYRFAKKHWFFGFGAYG